jgi:hypothetical protein
MKENSIEIHYYFEHISKLNAVIIINKLLVYYLLDYS